MDQAIMGCSGDQYLAVLHNPLPRSGMDGAISGAGGRHAEFWCAPIRAISCVRDPFFHEMREGRRPVVRATVVRSEYVLLL